MSTPPSQKCTAPQTAIFFQDACLDHKYIRSKDTAAIYERPERIRAITAGISAAIARLEESFKPQRPEANLATTVKSEPDAENLANALGQMSLEEDVMKSLFKEDFPITIKRSDASVNLLDDPAVKFVHGDNNISATGEAYLSRLRKLSEESSKKIENGDSEIPEGLSQGDLYLCPESVAAIQGSIATVMEAVDTVVHSSRHIPSSSGVQADRAFVAIRPPGHHCGEDSPSGFCFVNNVAIGTAHAHLKHGINRVVIFDIDLHHGNGTQSIVWSINEETYRKELEYKHSNGQAPYSGPGLQIYYGSIHDVLSYPCEDGRLELVQAASISIHGPHGQHIENIHLRPYTSEEEFFEALYKNEYSRLIKKAEDFIQQTGGDGDNVMVFISCGFDASLHEYPSMSRHERKVPTAFFHRFAKDACAFADKWAKGRVVSVLEGGYSDRALMSGAMAHVVGLVDGHAEIDMNTDENAGINEWWSVDNLIKLEKALKKKRPQTGQGRRSFPGPGDRWLDRTLNMFYSLDAGERYLTNPSLVGASTSTQVRPSTRILRGRKELNYCELLSGDESDARPTGGRKGVKNGRKSKGLEEPPPPVTSERTTGPTAEWPPKRKGGRKSDVTDYTERERKSSDEEIGAGTKADGVGPVQTAPKKLPKVILKVKPQSAA